MNKKICRTLIGTVLCLGVLTGCQTKTEQPDPGSAQNAAPVAADPELSKRKFIIDTDTGADDASALILAARSGADILGVTTLVGNVGLEQSTQNAMAALELAGSQAPVYRGAATRYSGENIVAFSVFGEDGMGDANLVHPTGTAQEQDAVSFILDTVKANPGEVELVVLGPATNIALAIEQDPETMRQVKRIWSMGSAGRSVGNASPVAEFNVYADAEAYKIMLDSGIPITVIGLDMCGDEAMWTGAQFDTLASANAIGSFVTDSFTKIRAFYAQNGYADSVMNCDGLAMMCVLYPDMVKDSISAHGSCIVDKGSEAYAQVIYYAEGFSYDLVKNEFDYNVTLLSDVDRAAYFPTYLKAIQD